MKTLISVLTVLLFAGCVSAPADTITVASRKADCVGVAPMKCLVVKEAGSDEWTLFYDAIEGFDYEEGYEYVLEVKRSAIENPPMDASSIRTELVRVISKEKKDSDIPFGAAGGCL